MAVTIDEMYIQVEAQDSVSSANSSPSTGKPKKDVDLRATVEFIDERKLRLRAD
jgi:hypothetical protein